MTNLSEFEMTVALEAAAKQRLADLIEHSSTDAGLLDIEQAWRELGKIGQHQIKEALLSVVVAAMGAVTPLIEQRVRLERDNDTLRATPTHPPHEAASSDG